MPKALPRQVAPLLGPQTASVDTPDGGAGLAEAVLVLEVLVLEVLVLNVEPVLVVDELLLETEQVP